MLRPGHVDPGEDHAFQQPLIQFLLGGAALIAAVSMGLSVDAEIHYVTRFRQLRKAGQSVSDALHAVRVHAAQVCPQQHLGFRGGVLGRHARGREHLSCESLERGGAHLQERFEGARPAAIAEISRKIFEAMRSFASSSGRPAMLF